MSKFEGIKNGLLDAIEYTKGNKKNCIEHTYSDVDVKAIREKLKMTQDQFALEFGLNQKSIQNWEQGRKKPTGATKVLLRVIETNHKIVSDVIHGQTQHSM